MQFSSWREALHETCAKESAVTCNTSTNTSDIYWRLLKNEKYPRNSLELSQQTPVCLVQKIQKNNYVNAKIIFPHYVIAQAGAV